MLAELVHQGHKRQLSADLWGPEIASLGFQGVIFDCDGTLVDSTDAHFRSMQTAMRAQGHDIDRGWYAARTGLDRINLFQALQSEIAPDLDVPRAIDTSIHSFTQHVGLVKPIPETIALFRQVKARGLGCAVATNAERDIARQSLTAVGLLDDVDVLVSISDNVRPKPAPDLFALAARRMGVHGPTALVLEDSPQGVAAAFAAGMSVLRVGV